jgi:type IV secretion system protein VirB4
VRPQHIHPASWVPYQYYADDGVIVCDNGALLAGFALHGALFDTCEDQVLNRQRDAFNQMIRALPVPESALWLQVSHRQLEPPQLYSQADTSRAAPFAQQFVKQYAQKLANSRLFGNQWSVSVIYQPKELRRTAAPVWGLRGLNPLKASATSLTPPTHHQLQLFEELCHKVEAALTMFNPKRMRRMNNWPTASFTESPTPLAAHSRAESIQVSSHYESACLLWSHLAQCIDQQSGLRVRPTTVLDKSLIRSDIHIGWELVEIQNAVSSTFGAMLGILEYPSQTYPGMLDRLLAAPFEWELTQSFTPMPKAVAQGLMSQQAKRLYNTNDPAISQQQALYTALDALTSNEFVLGEHHLSLLVLSDPVPKNELWTHERQHSFLQSLSTAMRMCAQAGCLMTRENLALTSMYFAQLPGNHRKRARVVPITSLNQSSLFSVHTIAKGQPNNNAWGECLIPLKTAAHTVFYFSLHPPEKMLDSDTVVESSVASDSVVNHESIATPNDSKPSLVAAHTFICGPTGSGKTVFAATLMTLLAARQVTQIIFDKDQGLSQLVRALNGQYLALDSQTPLCLNPLTLANTLQNRRYLVKFIKSLLPKERRHSFQDNLLDQAIAGVLELPLEERRLSRLREFFDPTERFGPYELLARWCRDTQGVYADCFDQQGPDQWQALLTRGGIVGIDMTEALKNEDLREPLCSYLFHLINGQVTGQATVVWIDEFGRFIKDDAFVDFVDDALKTWRKRNAVMGLITQSPSDTRDSDIARTIIEQMPTRIYFPNANAAKVDYCHHFGLNDREFELISRVLPARAHQFLICQSQHSVVVELDLKDCPAELAVLGSTQRPTSESVL